MSETRNDRWTRADRILERALELDADARVAFVRAECENDPELLALVERLLSNLDTADDPLTPGGWAEYLPADDLLEGVAAESSLVGQQVGGYRIVREIGRGGMAEVYLAERRGDEFHHRVALKVIKRGFDTDEVVRRFRKERQLMALAEHPDICRFIDGGATDDGRPYFVMEYVEGLPIDRYCDEHDLDPRRRIELFIRLARVVAHAHRNLVVHRDIKPSNVIVSRDGHLKLLDFGIAGILDEESGGAVHTRTVGARFFTPAYASPEQAAGHPVTTASDVYQLGLLLYVLLTGRAPYDSAGRGTPELLRVIRESQPTRPSEVVPPRLVRTLRGDLDNIVLKALRKEPERRYRSVEQLIEDLERWAAGRPVSARPDTLGYRLRKLVGRHRVAAALAATSLLLLVGFAVAMTVQAQRLAVARDRAEREAAATLQTANFLAELFQVSDPSESRGDTVTAREILDRGARRIEHELTADPEVQARLMLVIGEVYKGLGLYDDADHLEQRAVERYRELLGVEHPDTFGAESDLASLQILRGEQSAAVTALEDVLRRALEVLGEDHEQTASIQNALAVAYVDAGRHKEAEQLFLSARATQTELLGSRAQATLSTLNNLAAMYSDDGRFDEALPLYLEVVEARRQTLGRTHPQTASAINNLGLLYKRMGNLDAAEPLYRESRELRHEVLGPEHPHTLASTNNLAMLLVERGELDQAQELLEQLLETQRRVIGPDHWQSLGTLMNLARVHKERGDFARAEPLNREAVERARATLPEGHWMIGMFLGHWARSLAGLGRLDEAEAAVLEAYRILDEAYGPEHPRTEATAAQLVQLYEHMGRADAAERWRARVAGTR